MRSISQSTVGVLDRLQGGEQASTNRKIFNAAALIAVATLAVKAVSLVKDQMVAAWFGTGSALDAFLIAYMLPSFVIIVVGASFNAALIPTYIRVRDQEGPEEAHRLFSGVLLVSLCLLVVTALLLAIAFPALLPLIAGGFDAAKLHETRVLFELLLPAIVINGLSTLMAAVLNADERFALAALSPALMSFGAIGALWFFGAGFGVRALALGTLAGLSAEFVVRAVQLWRRGVRFRLPARLADPTIKEVLRQYLPLVAAAFLMSGTTIVDQAMAAALPAGSVAQLNYGNKIVALGLNLGASPLATAVFPYFSQMVARRDWAAMRHVLKSYGTLIVVTMTPLTALLCLVSEPIIRVLFQHGAFTAANTHQVALVQQMLLLQVPFFLLCSLLSRLVLALQGNRIILLAAMLSLPIDIGMNWLGMKILGIAGIAFSTSLVYVVSFVFFALALRHLLRKREDAS